MKKGKYIDINVIMACLSHKNAAANMQGINDLINKGFAPRKEKHHMDDWKKNLLLAKAM